MLDLFCGRWGWSRAFAARGWECVGVDLVEPPTIPQGCTFARADILECSASPTSGFWYGNFCNEPPFDFICASPPCEQFSTLRNFRQPVAYPALGIKLFNHTREICEASGVPYVMENVAGAMRYVGKPVNRCGPFYLWGTGVPPLMPQGIRKGLTALVMGCRERKGQAGWNDRGTDRKGQNDTAKVATIPPELSACVADYAERLLEGVKA
jgi:hypothetical protein